MMRQTIRAAAAAAFLVVTCCATTSDPVFAQKQRAVRPAEHVAQWDNDWARGAVFYEVFVRSFYDSNADGKGDLQGLIAKLDYLKDLHVDALWLMPVFESPSYHGYDTTDYETIESDYGTNADFQQLIDEAHKRGIKVIIDLVMNHTSSEHPWFIDSASGPSSPKRDWYIWSPTDPGWRQPWGGDPSWHSLNGAFYYGVFWSGMPDLNYRNPQVKAEMFRIAREWLAKGVDGYRLDATRYLVEDGPGPGQADTPETHQLLREFSLNVAQTKPDAVLVAENTVDTKTLATYYSDVPMNFDFPLAGTIVGGVSGGTATGITSTLQAINALYPAGAIDAPFLTNHDQTRLATILGSDAGKLRDAAAILLTLPGAAFLYYGEEVGLQNGPTGGDESKRTPMPWTASGGFTAGTPWFQYAPGTSTSNVASEIDDPNSLLSYYRRWIDVRKGSTALMKGTITTLNSGTGQVLAFLRQAGDERVLVVHNVSAIAANAGPLAVSANAFDVMATDAGVSAPTGTPGAWRVALPPHTSAVFRIR